MAVAAAAVVFGALSLLSTVTRRRKQPDLAEDSTPVPTPAVSSPHPGPTPPVVPAPPEQVVPALAVLPKQEALPQAVLPPPAVLGDQAVPTLDPIRRPPSVFDAWASIEEPTTAGSSVATTAPSTAGSSNGLGPSGSGVGPPGNGLGPPGGPSGHATQSASAGRRPETGLRAYKWQAFVAIGTAFVTIVLASTMVFVLLSAIADDFGVTLRAVGWVVIIESLIISALLLPMGAVADVFGRRRMFVVGLAVFGAGSIMSGLAPSFAALIAARMVMAVGNAGVQSVITGMLVAAFPPEERGRAVGAQTTAVSIGAACGPLIGGLALQAISWKTLFLLLGIPVAVSIVAAQLILRDDRVDTVAVPRSFDRVGSFLSAATVVVLVFTISNPLAVAWLSWSILAGGLLVVGLLTFFIRWELRHPDPMIELRLFAIPSFRWAVLVRLLGFIGYATTALLLPIYLVSFRGLADGVAGAILFLVSAGTGISAQISGNLSDRIGPRAPTVVGLIGQILVSLVLVGFGENISTGLLIVVVFLSGVSSGQWNVPNNSAMMGSVPAENLGVIGAFTNVVRTMGSVLGQAIATAVVVAVMAGQGFDIPLSDIADTAGAGAAFLDGWDAAFIVVAIAAAIALFAAFRLPAHPIGVDKKETR